MQSYLERIQQSKVSTNQQKTSQRTKSIKSPHTQVEKKATLRSVKKAEDEVEISVLDRVPPNIKDALKHAKAKRVGSPIDSCKEVCECCGLQTDNELLSLWCDTIELSFLGPGIPLYFGFLKASLVLLTFSALIFTIYGMISNSKGSYCKDNNQQVSVYCQNSFSNNFSLINKIGDSSSINEQNWINLVTVFVLIVILHLYRRHVRQQEGQLDQSLISPSDFTAQLNDLPPKYTTKDIEKLMNDWWSHFSKKKKNEIKTFKVEKVCIAYEVAEYMEKINERQEIGLFLRKELKNAKGSRQELAQMKQEMEIQRKIIQREIDNLEELVFSGNYDKTTPICFVTFNSKKVLQALLDSQKMSSFQRALLQVQKAFGTNFQGLLKMNLYGKNYFIKVKRAPEPSDVKWENCQAAYSSKLKKRCLTWFITFILLGISFLFIYFIKKLKADAKLSTSGSIKTYIISFFSSFAVVFINNLLQIAINYLSKQYLFPFAYSLWLTQISMELQSTVTSLNISMAEKLSIAQFCNSALVMFVINQTISDDQTWSAGGLTNDFMMVALTNCFVSPLVNYFNPFYLIRILMREKIKNLENKYKFSQGEANSWFEGSPLALQVKYASIIKTLWMLGFYAPLSPFVLPIGILTLSLSYWMDKYLLLNRQSRPNLIGSELNKEMIEMAEYFPFSIAIGNLVWMWKIGAEKDGVALTLQLIAIFLSALNFIIPSEKINQLLFKVEEDDEDDNNMTYEMNKFNFAVEYDRCNPITKEEAIKAYFKQLNSLDHVKAEEFIKKTQFTQSTRSKNIFSQLISASMAQHAVEIKQISPKIAKEQVKQAEPSVEQQQYESDSTKPIESALESNKTIFCEISQNISSSIPAQPNSGLVYKHYVDNHLFINDEYSYRNFKLDERYSRQVSLVGILNQNPDLQIPIIYPNNEGETINKSQDTSEINIKIL